MPQLGGAGTFFDIDGVLFTDFNGTGMNVKVGAMGAGAGRLIVISPPCGSYAEMTARTDLLSYVGMKFRTFDVGVVPIDWITDGTTWRPLDVIICTGTPLGAITAPVGSLARRTDGGTSTTLYVKESAADATGWVAK